MTASTICEDFPTLTGRQEPHHLSVFPGDLTHGEKSVELGRRAGSIAMPWQIEAQHAILSTTPSGRWTHTTCCLIVPRQNGKSEILIQRCLYGLFKLDETIIYTAQRWKTARDAWRRLMAIINSRPWLKKRVVRSTCSQGEGIIELASGAVISIGTRSNDSGRGLTDVDLIVYDEAYNLTDGEISAMSFTQMAAKNPQRIYASSAVNQDQHPNGAVLASVRTRGLNREPKLYFAEYMAPLEMPRDDEESWRYANPSYGVIQTADKILDIMRDLATPAGRKGFDVEALGRGDWPVEETETPSVIDMELWASMENLTPALAGPIALAVDMTGDRKWCTIAAATHTADDRIHLEVGFHDASTRAAVDKIVDLVKRWRPCALVINASSPAMALLPDLKKQGIEPEATSAAQAAQAAGGFYDDAIASRLSHTSDPRMTEALAGVVKKELSGGSFGWDFRSPVVLSPLQAATLARWGLVTFGPTVKPEQMPTHIESHDSSETHELMSAGF